MLILMFLIYCHAELVLCGCEEFLVVRCDSMNDILYSNRLLNSLDSCSWKSLEVGTEWCTECDPRYSLTVDHTRTLNSLQQLHITGQLKNINPGVFTRTYKLTYLKFYENDVRILETETFLLLSNFSKIILTNNNISVIRKGVFSCQHGASIEALDLSRNRLKLLKYQALSGCAIKTLDIRHNKLTGIQTGAYNDQHLEQLHLDYNNFQFTLATHVKNLPKLCILTMSHNKLSSIGDISSLIDLIELDLSFNMITNITNDFDHLKKLKIIHLNNNNLVTFTFPMWVGKSSHFRNSLAISLSNNNLGSLDLEILQRCPIPFVLTLRGNPWNCRCYDEMQEFLSNLRFYFPSDCDRDMTQSGEVPYCVISQSYNEPCSNGQIDPELLEKFRKLHTDKFATSKICN